MKAKTMCKRTRAVKKKKIVFQPDTTGMSLGSGASTTFPVEDANLSALHALVGLHDDGQVYLKAMGRTYFLIGAAPTSPFHAEAPLSSAPTPRLSACLSTRLRAR